MKEQVTIHPTNLPEPLTVTKREIGQVLRDRAQELFRMVLLKLDSEHLQELPLEDSNPLALFFGTEKEGLPRKVRPLKTRSKWPKTRSDFWEPLWRWPLRIPA